MAKASLLINHLVVGILLLPLSISLIVSAKPLVRKEPWASWLSPVDCLALLALPVILLAATRDVNLEAPAFPAAALLICLAALLLGGSVFYLCVTPRGRTRTSSSS